VVVAVLHPVGQPSWQEHQEVSFCTQVHTGRRKLLQPQVLPQVAQNPFGRRWLSQVVIRLKPQVLTAAGGDPFEPQVVTTQVAIHLSRRWPLPQAICLKPQVAIAAGGDLTWCAIAAGDDPFEAAGITAAAHPVWSRRWLLSQVHPFEAAGGYCRRYDPFERRWPQWRSVVCAAGIIAAGGDPLEAARRLLPQAAIRFEAGGYGCK
jgi:hypothetical protein